MARAKDVCPNYKVGEIGRRCKECRYSYLLHGGSFGGAVWLKCRKYKAFRIGIEMVCDDFEITKCGAFRKD